jgi:hypothetical protein
VRVSAIGLPAPSPHPRIAFRDWARAREGDDRYWTAVWYLADGVYEAGRGDEAVQALSGLFDAEAIDTLKQRAQASRR